MVYNVNMNTNRTRTAKGTFRVTRFDTQVGTIEKKYGLDLGVKSNMQIGNFLKQKGYTSLSRLLNDVR